MTTYLLLAFAAHSVVITPHIHAREAAAFRAGAEAMRSRVSNWHTTQSNQFRKPQQHGTLTDADITRTKWASASHGAHAVTVNRMPLPDHQSSTQTGTKPT